MKKLVDQEAKRHLDKIKSFLASDSKVVPGELRISVKGYYREDSYEWLAYSWQVKQGMVTLTTKQYLQHPGECQKYLDTI